MIQVKVRLVRTIKKTRRRFDLGAGYRVFWMPVIMMARLVRKIR